MRIDDGSICFKCEYFYHECDVPVSEDDWQCIELCNIRNVKSKDKFYEDENKIIECEGFKNKERS